MKAKQRIVALVAATAMLAGLTATAQDSGPGFGHGFGMHRPPMERALGPGSMGRWWNDPAMIEKLKLTEEQRKSMDQILFQHREKLIDMRANVEKAELGMQPLLQADQPNEAQVLAQIDKTAQARAELEKTNARFLLAIRAKLTPEQWKQLQADRAEGREMHRMGPGGMHHRRGGSPDAGSPDAPPAGGSNAAPPGAPGPQGLLEPETAPWAEPIAAPGPEIGAVD